MTNIEMDAARATCLIARNTQRIAEALERLLALAECEDGQGERRDCVANDPDRLE